MHQFASSYIICMAFDNNIARLIIIGSTESGPGICSEQPACLVNWGGGNVMPDGRQTTD